MLFAIVLYTRCGDSSGDEFLGFDDTDGYRYGSLPMHTNQLTPDQECVLDIKSEMEQQTDDTNESECLDRDLCSVSNIKPDLVTRGQAADIDGTKYEALKDTAFTNPLPAKYIRCRSPSFLFPKNSFVDGRSDAQPLESRNFAVLDSTHCFVDVKPETHRIECANIAQSEKVDESLANITINNSKEQELCNNIAIDNISGSCFNQKYLEQKNIEHSNPLQNDENWIKEFEKFCETRGKIKLRNAHIPKKIDSDLQNADASCTEKQHNSNHMTLKRSYTCDKSFNDAGFRDDNNHNSEPKKLKIGFYNDNRKATQSTEPLIDMRCLKQQLSRQEHDNNNASDSTSHIEPMVLDEIYCQRIKQSLIPLIQNTCSVSSVFNAYDFRKYYANYENNFSKKKGKTVIHMKNLNFDCASMNAKKRLDIIIKAMKSLKYTSFSYEIKRKVENDLSAAGMILVFSDSDHDDSYMFTELKSPSLQTGGNQSVMRHNVRAIYSICHGKIQLGTSFIANSKIYMYFMYGMFMEKQIHLDVFTLKPTLWRLQLFMPEIYFYIVWRLKLINEAITSGNEYDHDFCSEMNHVHSLLDFFYSFATVESVHEYCLRESNNEIYQYRCFIKSSLEKNHFGSAQCCLYDYAMGFYEKRSLKTISNINADMMFMLTFAIRPQALNNNTKEMLKIKDRRMGFDDFFNSKLCRADTKVELVKTLQSLVDFMVEMTQKSNSQSNKNVYAYKIFKSACLEVTPAFNSRIVDIKFLPNHQLLKHFYAQIYRILIE